jgi:MFS family permease
MGGVLTEYLGWEWVLWVNVPIALVAAALAPLWALANQLAAVRERPEAVLAGAAVGATAFAFVALAAVPQSGASGAATAMLAGVAATTAATFAALGRRA